MPRKQKKLHYIYKTTNIINGKYYIGMHSTDNVDDGYIGSGKLLWFSIKKYGKENFVCEILEYLPNRQTLKEREKEIVNKILLEDKSCLNLKLGGYGGFVDENHKYKFHSSGGRKVRSNFSKIHQEKMKNDKEYREKIILKLKSYKRWLGKKHKEESKKKIGEKNSISQKGEKNSQFGTCWITNGVDNKKIKKTEKLPNGWVFGRK